MKKLFIFLLSIWFLPKAILADTGNLPERTIENVADGVIVTYQFNNPIIRPNHLVPGSFLWQYEGFGINDVPGEPAIPVLTDMFYIPAGHKAQITLLDNTYKDTTLVLSPAIPNPPDDGSKIVIDSIKPYIGFFPNNVLDYGSTQNFRGIGLQCVTIAPIKYNINTHIVRFYTKIQYRIKFVAEADKQKANMRNNSIPDNMGDFLSNITLNYTSPRLRNDSTWHSHPNNHNYLIITTSGYYSAIQDFVKWKRLKGNNVYTVTLEDWTTENVKAFIDAFLDVMDLHYLLIVGGNNDVPGVPFTYTYWNNHNQIVVNAVTDYEYGLETETDSLAQFFRGRITGNNSSEITSALNKIIQYEKNPTMDENFYKTALHCAEYQDRNNGTDVEDGYEDRAFVLTSENVRNHIVNLGYNVCRQYATSATITPFHWSKIYSNGYTMPPELQSGAVLWNGNADSIRAIINNGVFFVLYRGHGQTTNWYNPYFENYDMSLLQNGNKQPVIFSIACHTGKYNTPAICFEENALRKSNGGCVGIFAATEISFSGYNDALTLGMFDAIWPNLQPTYYFNKYSGYSDTPTPTYELGQILDQGLIRMGRSFGHNSFYSKVTKRLFHCFGDPSMQIYTDKPQKIAEPLIFSREDSIFVFVEDGDCRITFYDKVTEDVKSYTGNYASYVNPSDSLIICLDRHNYVPYIWDYEKNIYIQNENIQSETRNYKGNTIYVGNNVTSTKPTGNVNIQNSHITILGKRLELHPGTRIDKNFIFQNR